MEEDNLNGKPEAAEEREKSSAGGFSNIPAPPPLPPALPPLISPLPVEYSRYSLLGADREMTAVLEELSSKNVTEGLKKVTDDMKAKYHAGKTGLVKSSGIGRHTTSLDSSKVGTPKFELQTGRKWLVENQIGKRKIVIDDCDPKQTVYVYGCQNSILHIRGKVNNITVDNCTKVGVVFRDVVAACEVVNCNRVEIQCEGFTPMISVDNTSGCQLYLSKDSLEASLTTAKSSEINVMVPGAEPDGDWGEHPLPQQYIHKFKDGQFITKPVDHTAG